MDHSGGMRDEECIGLLQWMLPRMQLRWAGFRRVRKQVCKRLSRRLKTLGLRDANAYRKFLESNPEEWSIADSLLRVTISRFYRDRAVFAFLASHVLPSLGTQALHAKRPELRLWSAGCASGEEPYSVALLWHFEVARRFPGLALKILATDADQHLLVRARAGRYPPGCLKNLPENWRLEVFRRTDSVYQLSTTFMNAVQFQLHDLRSEPPDGVFDLVLCRNVAFTYFDEPLQLATAEKLGGSLRNGGALVIGSHEQLPAETRSFLSWCARHQILPA